MSVTLYTVNRQIYEALQAHLVPLLGEYRASLEELGVGRSSDALSTRISEVADRISRGPSDQPQLQTLVVRGVLDPRRELLLEMFLALGSQRKTADRYGRCPARPRAPVRLGEPLPAALAASTGGGAVLGQTMRRVFDVHRVVGGQCTRFIEEEFTLTIDGASMPLRGSTRFRIGRRPMHECRSH